jgi:hypothetical protein
MKMKKMIFLMLVFFMGITASMNAQVAIGTGTGADGGPVAGAVLELDGTKGALLLPRVDGLATITSPAAGMLVYLKSDNQVYIYDGTSWNVYAGPAGATGAAGNGISTTVIDYATSASGTTIPSSGWDTNIPSVSAGQYLWTRTVITYTDATTSTAYSIGGMGATGETGPTGPAGPSNFFKGVVTPDFVLNRTTGSVLVELGCTEDNTWLTPRSMLNAGFYVKFSSHLGRALIYDLINYDGTRHHMPEGEELRIEWLCIQ